MKLEAFDVTVTPGGSEAFQVRKSGVSPAEALIFAVCHKTPNGPGCKIDEVYEYQPDEADMPTREGEYARLQAKYKEKDMRRVFGEPANPKVPMNRAEYDKQLEALMSGDRAKAPIAGKEIKAEHLRRKDGSTPERIEPRGAASSVPEVSKGLSSTKESISEAFEQNTGNLEPVKVERVPERKRGRPAKNNPLAGLTE